MCQYPSVSLGAQGATSSASPASRWLMAEVISKDIRSCSEAVTVEEARIVEEDCVVGEACIEEEAVL